jgi:hypothetical protein
MRQVMCDLDPGRYSDLSKIAHFEMRVDKSNNLDPALPGSRRKRAPATSALSHQRTLKWSLPHVR